MCVVVRVVFVFFISFGDASFLSSFFFFFPFLQKLEKQDSRKEPLRSAGCGVAELGARGGLLQLD